MRRYLRLYAYFLRFSFSRAMEFRIDFLFRIFMDSCWYAIHMAFFVVLFRFTQTLGSWNMDQIYIFAATVFVMDAVQMTLFSNNIWMFPIAVNKGDLDYHLVRPVSSLFFVSLRDFAANSFVNLLIAAGILIWAIARYPEPLGAGRIALFVLLQLFGVFLFYALSMIATIPVFWLHSRSGVRELFWSLQRFSLRPHRIYTGWVGRVLVSGLPFAFIASYPCMVLFEGPTLTGMLHATGVVAGAFALVLAMWSRALRVYASASS